MKKKLDHWERTQNPEREELSETVEGIRISDRLLKERFGDQEPEILVYGGINPSDNMKKFLALPSKMKVFGKFDILKEEVKSETEATKARWDHRDRTERVGEGEDPITNNLLRIEKDR